MLAGCLKETKFVCTDGSEVASREQCLQVAAGCGNGVVEQGESSENCCVDAGCLQGSACLNGRCVLLSPDLRAVFSQSENTSVTLLKSRIGRPVGVLSVFNSGNDDAKDVFVTFSSPEGFFSQKTVELGSIAQGAQVLLNVSLDFSEKVLQFSEKTVIPVSVKFSFKTSANRASEAYSDFKVSAFGRNSIPSFDWPAAYAAWVAPHQNVVREFAAKSTSGLSASVDSDRHLAARWLFESLKSYGVGYVDDVPTIGDYVQLPMETLKKKNGDCEDLAILYSSLLESIGIKTAILVVPGHAFMGYFPNSSSKEIIPVETTAKDFDEALNLGKEIYSRYLRTPGLKAAVSSEERGEYAEVLFSDEPVIPMPDISKQAGECRLSFSISQILEAQVDYSFTNNGNAPGAGCGYVATVDSGGLRDAKYGCWTVQPGQTVLKTLSPKVDVIAGLTGYSCFAR